MATKTLNGIEIDDSYALDLDDDENYASDELYKDEDNQNNIDSSPLTLDDVIEILEKIQSELGFSNIDMQFNLVEICMKTRQGINLDLLLNFMSEDTHYKAFLIKLIPELKDKLPQEFKAPKDVGTRADLINALIQASIMLIWLEIEKRVVKEGLDQQELKSNIDGKYNFYPKQSDIGMSDFIFSMTRDWSEVGQNGKYVIDGALKVLTELKDLAKIVVTIDEDELNPDIIANTARVLNVYKDLFEVGYELQAPFGVLTKEGFLRIDADGKTELKKLASLANLYALLKDLTGDFLVQTEITPGTSVSNLRDIKFRQGTTYYPEFQLSNLFGILGDKKVDSWNDFRRYVEPEVHHNIKTNFIQGKNMTSIVDALTTCIVISEFDATSALRLRINIGNNLLSVSDFKKAYEDIDVRAKIMAGNGELFHIQQQNTGVLEIILVFNKAAFNGRPLFAYEAVQNLQQRGRVPRLSDMILGQDTSGKILTTNLDRQSASIILIGAGQRSGKGVLTLNLLGTVLAEGCPLIYLDGKPDMAPVLWNLGSKYGIKPAVWDAFERHGNKIGVGAPKEILIENPGIFGILMYLKAVQLMMVAASLEAKGKKLSTKRPFFIFDEALAVQMSMKDNWSKIIDFAKSKDKDLEPEIRDWCKAVVQWAESLSSSLPGVINSQLPMSGISTVWLFQSMQPTSWSAYDTAGIRAKSFNILKSPIMSRLSIKILGKGTADSEYGLSKIKDNPIISGRVLAEGGRHFVYTGSQKITDMEAVTVFKPYLVLNTAENGTNAVDELRKNVSSEVWDVIAQNGSLHPGAGFEGFATLLGQDAIQNLGLGRAYLETVLRATPLGARYQCVDDYLYDASIESFKSLGVLTSDNIGQFDNSKDNENDDNTYSSWSTDYIGSANSDHSSKNNEETKSTSDKASNSGFGKNKADDASKSRDNQEDNLKDAYTGKIKMPYNPFKAYGTSTSPIPALNVLRNTSKALLAEIKRYFGDLNRVESINIKASGLLIINNRPFRPQFDPKDIESMPEDIRDAIRKGQVAEIFDFGSLYKFKNLQVLEVADAMLAEGRMRREMGINRGRPWSYLFTQFSELRRLVLGNEVITDKVTAQDYDMRGRGGYTDEAFARVPSRMAKVWNTRPAKVIMNALGYTIGLKALGVIALTFGPLGLVYGALVGALTYNEFKKTHPRQTPQQNRQTWTGQNHSQAMNQSRRHNNRR